MKKITISIAMLIMTSSFAQKNFKWEKIDSINKNKESIYSDTKMFIANYWKSSKDIIQNDDKEAGTILIKATKIIDIYYLMYPFSYSYNYTVTFRMKENKYKINIDNVYCDGVYCANAKSSPPKIEPFEKGNCPTTMNFFGGGISKEKAELMMGYLKKDLQTIVDDYTKSINVTNDSSKENGW